MELILAGTIALMWTWTIINKIEFDKKMDRMDAKINAFAKRHGVHYDEYR